ncbi:helix-turn-helix transcriptional regulator [Frankia sp. Cppng1_Ct_nod]|uniref:helix-turn-helix domain-containing protein n=1 Tax=Frankia sp. Cppng1_Ct_nod TaxID=2897162 RepID=UPI0013EF995A|nr:helix-turn-helix transcriptional regulator [Frankia sp. Cppng1_Ct_nod]
MRLPVVVLLGVEIRRQRLASGLSQRELARRVGLSSHSNLGDYERGVRLPPRDIVTALEAALGAVDGAFGALHRQALLERAEAWANRALREGLE